MPALPASGSRGETPTLPAPVSPAWEARRPTQRRSEVRGPSPAWGRSASSRPDAPQPPAPALPWVTSSSDLRVPHPPQALKATEDRTAYGTSQSTRSVAGTRLGLRKQLTPSAVNTRSSVTPAFPTQTSNSKVSSHIWRSQAHCTPSVPRASRNRACPCHAHRR